MINQVQVAQPIGLSKKVRLSVPEIMDFFVVIEKSRRLGGDVTRPLKILSRVLFKLELLSTEYSLFRKLWLTRLIVILSLSVGARILMMQFTYSQEFTLVSNMGVVLSLLGFIGLTFKGQSLSTFGCWFYGKNGNTVTAQNWWQALNQGNTSAILKEFPDLKPLNIMEWEGGIDCQELRFGCLEQFANIETQMASEEVRNKIDRMPLVELGCMLPLSLLMNIGPILEFNRPF